MAFQILTTTAASITELKRDPLTSSPTFTLRDSGRGFPLVGDR